MLLQNRLNSIMFRYANPAVFMRLSGVLLPWISGAAVILLAAGLWSSFHVPPDYQQGMTVTIMFVHVPAAIVAEAAYGAIAIASLFSLVWRHPLADTAARAHDLDEAAALAAKQRATEAMADRSGAINLAEAQAELARAIAQLRAIERLRKKR